MHLYVLSIHINLNIDEMDNIKISNIKLIQEEI